MDERPNPAQVLADALMRAGVDRLVAANIVIEVTEAIEAQRRYDDMQRWREGQNEQ